MNFTRICLILENGFWGSLFSSFINLICLDLSRSTFRCFYLAPHILLLINILLSNNFNLHQLILLTLFYISLQLLWSSFSRSLFITLINLLWCTNKTYFYHTYCFTLVLQNTILRTCITNYSTANHLVQGLFSFCWSYFYLEKTSLLCACKTSFYCCAGLILLDSIG